LQNSLSTTATNTPRFAPEFHPACSERYACFDVSQTLEAAHETSTHASVELLPLASASRSCSEGYFSTVSFLTQTPEGIGCDLENSDVETCDYLA